MDGVKDTVAKAFRVKTVREQVPLEGRGSREEGGEANERGTEVADGKKSHVNRVGVFTGRGVVSCRQRGGGGRGLTGRGVVSCR